MMAEFDMMYWYGIFAPPVVPDRKMEGLLTPRRPAVTLRGQRSAFL